MNPAPDVDSQRDWRRGWPVLIGTVLLAGFTLTRLVLAVMTGPTALTPEYWPGTLARGLMFDLATLAFLLAPVLLYEAILPARWRSRRWHRLLRAVWLWWSIAAALCFAAAEVTFWLEFSTRFNFIAVDYLIYTQEVIANIRQSYPVAAILAGIGVAAAAITFALRPAIRRAEAAAPSPRVRGAMVLAAVVLPLLSWSLTRIEQMEGSGNAYADELSGNGAFTFAAALRRNELDYDRFYRTMPQDEADRTLAGLGVERIPLADALTEPDGDVEDDVPDDDIPMTRTPSNLVLISVESLSASFLGAYGSTEGLTPNLDRIAADGVLFRRLFATGTRTVRGLEALSLGTPPVPGQAIVRRPANEHLATLGEVLAPQGMVPFFFYGGYGLFDNMNAYFGANRYRVVDRTDIPREAVTFENAWGVADEVLFDRTLQSLDATFRDGKPFFAHVMTTSNHRPFTYPDGRIDIPSPGGRAGAVKYTDHAIGRFIEQAKTRPWFADTLFLIVADHCASAAGKSRLPVAGYRIPAILYAPGNLKPGIIDTVTSQIDLVPTVVEMLGKRGDAHFFGRSVFERGPPLPRAFISNYQELGYYRDDLLTVLSPRRRVTTFRIDPTDFSATETEPDERSTREAIAYYQTAARAFRRGALAYVPPRRH